MQTTNLELAKLIPLQLTGLIYDLMRIDWDKLKKRIDDCYEHITQILSTINNKITPCAGYDHDYQQFYKVWVRRKMIYNPEHRFQYLAVCFGVATSQHVRINMYI